MASLVRIVLNRAAVRELLTSEKMREDLGARAQKIAEAAGEGFESSTYTGKTRARATVTAVSIEARVAEARDRALTRAIDAGR